MKKRPLFPPGVSKMTDIADAMRELRAKRETAESSSMKTLMISGKVSDLVYYRVKDVDGNVLSAKTGWVPYGVGAGDYIRIDIDIETGTIIGWDAEKTKQDLQEQGTDD